MTEISREEYVTEAQKIIYQNIGELIGTILCFLVIIVLLIIYKPHAGDKLFLVGVGIGFLLNKIQTCITAIYSMKNYKKRLLSLIKEQGQN